MYIYIYIYIYIKTPQTSDEAGWLVDMDIAFVHNVECLRKKRIFYRSLLEYVQQCVMCLYTPFKKTHIFCILFNTAKII